MDNNIMVIKNVRAYQDKNGIAQLNLEDVSRGLGFTENKNGVEYIMWRRVNQYLSEFNFDTSAEKEYIPENIFYKLCFKAKNEIARKFQDLVTDEVLPSIRKNGGYIAGQETLSDEELIQKALLVATNKLKERERQLEEQKPKVLFAESVQTSKTSILIGELAKIIKQNGYDIGQNRLFQWLRNNNYLISRKGTDYNMPTQKSMNLGLFEIKETTITHSDGHISISKTVKVTGDGQVYFVNKFLNANDHNKKGSDKFAIHN